MIKKLLLTGAILPALFLAGCGDGWEMRPYEGFPYGNVRTAGHGVEYVRANIMPKKEAVIKIIDPKNESLIKLEAKPASIKSPPVTPPPVETKEKNILENVLNSGEKFFRDLQRK